MNRSNVTATEALRRLLAATKLIDYADCKDESVWQKINEAQAVAERVVRDGAQADIHCQEFHELAMDYRSAGTVFDVHGPQAAYERMCAYINKRISPALRDGEKQEPVAYLRFRAAQSWSGSGNHDIEHNEWLETCHAHEVGDDKLPAFPVYSAPQPAAAPSGDVEREPYAYFVESHHADGSKTIISGRKELIGSFPLFRAAITATKE